MDTFEIGMKFPSYKALMQSMDCFSQQSKCKFWKRDARTILTAKNGGIQKNLKSSLVYFDLKFSCIYGGMDFKSKSKNIRQRVPSLKSTNCPAYLRFKASELGDALQLVAMNLNHNHELKLPKKGKRKILNCDSVCDKTNFEQLEKMDNIEIQLQEMFMEEEEEEQSVFIKAEETNNFPDETIVEAKANNFLDETIVEAKANNFPDETIVEAKVEDRIRIVPFTFRGLIAPVFTPFNNDSQKSLNLTLIFPYAQYLLKSGIKGVLINGTSGEGMCMTLNERKLVTEAWAKACSETKQHLMVQIGGTNLPDVIALAQHAEQSGANSLLCLPEIYYKPQTTSELINYLKIVGQAAPLTPLLYYHIPGITNVNIHMGNLLKEIQNEIPTFSGIKFTSTLLDEGVTAVLAKHKKYAVFLGADTIMAGAYALGFDSAIATSLNVFPDHGKLILNLIKNGNITEAQVVQEELNSAITIVTKNGSWVPTMKQAMKFFAPFQIGPCREPLIDLTPEQVETMETELKQLTFVKN